MPKYIVRKVYKSIEVVEVEADSEEEAREAAYGMDGHEVDYYLHDISAKEAI